MKPSNAHESPDGFPTPPQDDDLGYDLTRMHMDAMTKSTAAKVVLDMVKTDTLVPRPVSEILDD